MAHRLPGSQALLKCCVDLGSEFVDTRSNAEEADRWLALHHFRSLRLITSDWHMRRARYEFRKVLGSRYQLITDGVRSEPELPDAVRRVQQISAAARRGVDRPLMPLVRSLLFAAIFYPATLLWVLAGMLASLVGAEPARRVVMNWAAIFHWLAGHLLAHPCDGRGHDPAGPAPGRGQAPVDVRDDRDGPPHPAADHRHQARACRHPALRLDDPALWRHPCRPLRRREGAPRAGRAGKGGSGDRPTDLDHSRKEPGSQSASSRRSSRASPPSIERSACRSSRSRWTAATCGAAGSSSGPAS